MNALEWLPLVYPPGLFDLREKDATTRRGLPFSPQHQLHLNNNMFVSPTTKLGMPNGLYPPGLIRHMSMAMSDPSQPHHSIAPNLFMACQAAAVAAAADASSSAPTDPHIPFDLSRRFSPQSPSEQNEGSCEDSKEQPLDLRVSKNRMDENQNIIPSPDFNSTNTASPPTQSPQPQKEASSPFPLFYGRNLGPALPLSSTRAFPFSAQMNPLIQRPFHDVIGNY